MSNPSHRRFQRLITIITSKSGLSLSLFSFFLSSNKAVNQNELLFALDSSSLLSDFFSLYTSAFLSSAFSIFMK